MREEVGHLERAADGLGSLPDTRFRLLDAIEGEHTERDGDARLQRRELQPTRRLARHVVEVRRVTADDAAEGDDAGETARLRERGCRQRKLEGSGDDHDRDRVLLHARIGQLARARCRGAAT